MSNKESASKARATLKIIGIVLGGSVGFVILTTIAKIVLVDVLGWF